MVQLGAVRRWHVVAASFGALGAAAALFDGPRTALQRAAQDPHQALFVARNPHRPWLFGLGSRVHDDAKLREAANFGATDHLDDEGDAFRHTYAAALMTLRAMRDHDASPEVAGDLTIGLGDAHERDGLDNLARSAQMDRANNRTGVELVGDGRLDDGWLTEQQLEKRVLAALDAGRLVQLDPSGERLVPTSR